MNRSFKKTFYKLLSEADDLNALADEIDGANFEGGLDGEEAVDDQLGPDIDITDLDVEPSPQIDMESVKTVRAVELIKTWVTEIEDFIDYLNGLNERSINFQLSKSDVASILHDIQRSESKKISRVAQDLSAVAEAMKQYLMGAARKEEENRSNTV